MLLVNGRRFVRAVRLRGLALALFTGLGAAAQPSVAEDGNPTLDEILKTWNARRDALPPFMYKADVTEDVAVYRPPAKPDPFAPHEGASIGRLTANKNIVVKWQGESYWCSVTGEQVNEDGAEIVGQEIQRAFDGKVYRDFIHASRHPFGLGHFGKPEAVEGLIGRTGTSGEFAAVEWWRGPIALIPKADDKRNQLVLDLQAFAGTVLVDKYPCIELQYFFKGKPLQSLFVR